jgi:drug/metabolite transporter (DMT)-like permease
MSHHRESSTAGILWMLATMLCFITLDALMKYGLEYYSLLQVTWARFFFATLTVVCFCARDLKRLLRTRNLKLQLLRSTMLMTTTGLFNAGLRDVPLVTATSIMFLTPILVTLLSILILGEHVGLRRWISIVCGLAGAIVIIAPWRAGGEVSFGVLLLLAAALSNSTYQTTTRYLRDEEPMTSLLYTASIGTAVTTLAVPTQWTAPDATGWVVFVLCGLVGAIGHLFLIRAFRAAPASVVAPYAYSSLVWAVLFGFVFWQEWPAANVWVGATLIVAAGLYIFFRERTLAQSGGRSRASPAKDTLNTY